ncbi:MAG TPA: 5-carboxymethyl-2-hydroxymuconate Delta-isomerase [Ensifer sp.]|nr:5-carboxymethyl-2-hydroxymuconate Delta-isomerase [Ensifer sp.]
MPHFIIEASSNLKPRVDFTAVSKVVHQAILESGLFEIGAIRVRVHLSDDYAIADLDDRNAFVDMSFRIGAGRSAEEKKRVGEAIMAAVKAELLDLFHEPHFALSLEIREIDPALSWKDNAMHARLRGGQ